MSDRQHPLILFDGYCGLCNGFVDFVVARDPEARFRFASLQGETAARLAPEDAVPLSVPGAPEIAPRSIVFYDNGWIHRRSDAVLLALPRLGGIWRGVVVLRVIPRFLRDFVYDLIARNRTRWFGRRQTCRLPSEADAAHRARFLP